MWEWITSCETWSWITENENATVIATVLAIIALLYSVGRDIIGMLSKVINKKTSKIKIIPNDFMTLYYDKNGLSIATYMTLLSSKVEVVVSKMTIKVKDGREIVYVLDWDNFKPTTRESFSASATNMMQIRNLQLNKSEFTPRHPFYLFKNFPKLLNIGFFIKDESEAGKNKNRQNNNKSLNKDNNTIKLKAKSYEIVFEVRTVDDKIYSCKNQITLTEKDITTLQGQRVAKLSGNDYEVVLVDLQSGNKGFAFLEKWRKKGE